MLKVKLCLKFCFSQTTEANLIKDNEALCGAHDLGSYTQGQGGSQVRGQTRVSAITQKLLKQI